MTSIVIFNQDCRLLPMEQIRTCDVLYTDPPYRSHVHSAATSHGKAEALDETRRGTRKRSLGFDPLTEELRQFTAQCAASVRRWSVIYSDAESVTPWIETVTPGPKKTATQYIRTVPWIRWSMPQLSGDRPPQGWEPTIWFHRPGRKRWNGPGNLTHLAHKCLRGEDKHKTEKPLDQALDLVSWISDPGETVLDLFGGAFTFALACRILGRGYVGTELDAEWVARGQERVALYPFLSDRDAERLDRWLASGGKLPEAA